MRIGWVQKIVLGAVLALGASFVVMTPGASASSVSTVTASPNPATAGAHATYTVVIHNQRDRVVQPISAPITLIGPTGTVFPLVAVDYSVNGCTRHGHADSVGTANVTITSPVRSGTSAHRCVSGGCEYLGNQSNHCGNVLDWRLHFIDTTPDLSSNPTYSIVAGPVSAATTTIVASPTTLVANGSTQSTITVQAKDANGNNLAASGGAVTLHPTLGTIGTVTDNANGTYTATFTSPTTTGTSTITGTIGGNPITASTTIALTTGPVSAATTTIVASPTTLVANGSTQSTITVQAKDASGNNLAASGGAVTLHPTLGTIGTVTNNNNGTYTATFTSPATTGTSTHHRHHRRQPDNRIDHHCAHHRTGECSNDDHSWPARRHSSRTEPRSRRLGSRRRTPTATT